MPGRKSVGFDERTYAWRVGVDYRASPEEYRVGRGEQGVLICEPYKGEILPHWRFKTPDAARESIRAIVELFRTYLARGEFVGADMARKFLQMGFTRARRYTNYKGGRKYADDGEPLKRGTGDPAKAASAALFFDAWKAAEADPDYAHRKSAWLRERG